MYIYWDKKEKKKIESEHQLTDCERYRLISKFEIRNTKLNNNKIIQRYGNN